MRIPKIQVILSALAGLLISLQAFAQNTAYTNSDQYSVDLKAFLKKGLDEQVLKLSQLKEGPTNPACDKKYAEIWADGSLKLDLFYGYMNNHNNTLVLDHLMKENMIETLTAPCRFSNQGACGFKLIRHGTKLGRTQARPDILTKHVIKDGHRDRFEIRMFTSSLTDRDNKNNFLSGHLAMPTKAQLKKTAHVWSAYTQSLGRADVIIYDGHSRWGTGPGFGPFGGIQYLAGKLTHSSYKKFAQAFEAAEHKPKVMMLASCDSVRDYITPLQKISPLTSFLGTDDDEQSPAAGEQTVLTFIDSIASGRCEQDMNNAFATIPRTGQMGKSGSIRIFGFEDELLSSRNFGGPP